MNHKRKRSRLNPRRVHRDYIPKRYMRNDRSRRVFRDRKAGWSQGDPVVYSGDTVVTISCPREVLYP